MNVTILGAGAWGAALGKLLRKNGHAVTLWDIDARTLGELRAGHSERYLPGVALPTDWTTELDWDRAVAGRDCLVFAVPSRVFRGVASRLVKPAPILVSVTKGIEYDTGLTMCRILQEAAPGCGIAALSGPSFALEVARGIPTAIVCASESDAVSRQAQAMFHRPTFRVYRSTDTLGVELGGALKNIIAIGAGVCDGLGYGDNSKAALVTRAIAEMRRFGVACGAQAETFAGLSGLGDLTVTCFSRLSRNRALGERLGRGETMEAIFASAPKLAEGHPTARSAVRLARQLAVSTPIIDEVHAMLYEGKNVQQAVQDLLGRALKAED
ncbi:MAG: NAD(P)-dependent glycerol-3-phosphate dehydrogenase [Verrucomicrobia bacterium]|nr:NAD(P)-dependent glycerol-3-phosphate dehydrogenase [Verrucomicrobiota bacterium]